MHTLWTYVGENAIKQWTRLLRATCLKIQREPRTKLRQAWRHEVLQLGDRLYQEQRRLHRILCDIEQDWDRYMDRESRDQYYQHLSSLYLKAGGHQAGKQEPESNELYTLTHQVPAENVPDGPVCLVCGRFDCVCN